jgi:hypothetical protein
MAGIELWRAVGLQFGLQTLRQPMSAFEGKSDITDPGSNVRF